MSPDDGARPLVFGRAHPRVDAIPDARRACARWLSAHHVASEPCDDVQLVVSELVTNVVKHTRGSLQLELRTADDGVIVEVHDESSTLPSIVDAADDATGGRGLAIVNAIAERWGSRIETLEDGTPNGKVVWALVAA